MKELFKKLAKVQAELKAPKNQRNTFGKYNYRSKEDILEAAKPLCITNGLVLTIDDELLLVGERYYIKAIATITDVDSGSSYEVSGYAREADVKKGMDESQITGAASSYAGKYALNNLFGIDDTEDADATNTHTRGAKPLPSSKPTETSTKASTKTTKSTKGDTTVEGVPSGAKSSGKASVKKAMTDLQKENFLKGVSEGKFSLVGKHLIKYKKDANYNAVLAALVAAKKGK